MISDGRIFEEGFYAFYQGDRRGDNPYPVDTDDYDDWLAGYDEAEREYEIDVDKPDYY